nr:filamentous hemagglutinin N-terminal domain-containing protein [Iningainema tapete]
MPTEEITGGAVRGANLFHSFQEFNVDPGRSVYFLSPDASIQNILARVTGANRSEIFGTLGTIGNANLFLINPNGIIFGSNAALNVGGSFIGSTANAVQFGNIGNFSADTPNTPSPLLTINPSALLFNQLSTASITNKSTADAGLNLAGDEVTGLRVPDGRSLLLVGGNINLDGGNLRAYEGRIELAGLATPGSIGLDVVGNILSLNIPAGIPRADVSLINEAEVDVRGANGGNIAINAQNVNIAGESILSAGIESGNGSPDSTAGDIEINATRSITIDDGSLIANVVQPEAIGNGGNINITTGLLTLRDNALLNASTNGQGDSGRVFVQASGAVSLANSDVYNNVEASAVGNSRGILITAESLSLTNGAQVQSSILGANASEPGGRGNAVGVNINVGTSMTLTGVNQNGAPSGIFTDVEAGAVGNGGDININASSLSLTDGAELNASTNGLGDAGRVFVQVSGAVSMNNSDIFNNLGASAVGNNGGILITAESFSLTNGAQLQSSIYGANASEPGGRGNAVGVNINVGTSMTLTGVNQNGAPSGIFTDVEAGAVGNGGDINILAKSLSLTDGAVLDTRTSGLGNGGNMVINACDRVDFDGSDAFSYPSGAYSTVQSTGVGNAGNINVTTGSLSLNNGAQISAATVGLGKAGDIDILARSLSVANGGQVLTNTYGGGKAGTITLNVKDTLTLVGSDPNFTQRLAQVEQRLRQSRATDQLADVINNLGPTSGIFANTAPGSTGLGGSIFIDARQVSIRDGTKISVNSDGTGNAGNITILADILTLDNGAEISAQTTSSLGGNINLQLEELLLLRRGSQISTNAGTALKGGDGGNIQINSQYIIAVPQENSDITANAYTGTGGNIQINSEIFGIRSRLQSTDLSDITASSTLGVAGTVNIDTPNTDDVQNSLTQLPENIIDANALIANSCIAKRHNQ